MATETITLKLIAQDLASGNISKAIGKMDAMARQGGLMGNVMQGVGIQFGMMLNPLALLGRGLGAVTDFMGDAQREASAMVETQTKLDQVFDESADTIRDWSEDSAYSMGLSQQAALESAATLGNFLQALEVAEGEAAGMSTSVTQLAGDLASFNNTAGGAEEVLIALRSGLAGETEPMRRLGVDISATAVKTELLASGVEKVGAEFTQSQKVAARYRIIMRQTERVQGDFARTADGSANSQRTLEARTKDAQARFGTFADEVMRSASALAVEFVNATVAVADALDDIRRLFDPTSAAIEDQTRLIREQAAEMGYSEEAVLAFAAAQRLSAESASILGASQRLAQADIDDYRQSLEGFGYTQDEINERVEAWVAIQAENAEATREVTESVEAQQGAVDDIFSAYGELNEGQKTWFEAQAGVAAKAKASGEAIAGMGDGIDAAGDVIEAGAAAIVTTFKNLPPSIRDTIQDGKSTVREAMRDLRFAMQHPFAEKKYEDWLKDKQEKANKALTNAIAAGKEDAAYEAAALVLAIQTELGKLNNLDYSVDVKMRVFAARMGGAEGFAEVRERAAGGPVRSGRTYLVGEQGPELLHMGNTSGSITPNHKLGAGVMPFVYAPQYSTASPEEARRFADEVGPSIARWMRDSR